MTLSIRVKLVINLLFLASITGCGSSFQQSPILDYNVTTVANNQMVREWNAMAVDASGFDHSALGHGEQAGPTRASRAMAIVHIAMHDACQSIQGRYETYLPQESVRQDASLEAAIAQAAHDTLIVLFPSQTPGFETVLERTLAKLEDGPQKEAGIEAGRRAAAAIIAERFQDGSEPEVQTGDYIYGVMPGEFRPDPFSDKAALGAQWSLVKPFVLRSADQFRCPPPPSLDSPEYAEAFNEVKNVGGDGLTTPTQRTPQQTNIGLFWAYDGTPSLCAPPRLYNQVAMAIAEQEGLSELGDLTRMLALLNISLADSGIACWDSKFFYQLWRPVTGIREADVGSGPSGLGDGNSATVADPEFSPLGAPYSNLHGPNFTPPFPAYPSGHATFGGALFQVLRSTFGRDDISFTFVSDELNGVTLDNTGTTRALVPMSFSSLSQAEFENGKSRVYLGIHWNFDSEFGVKLGNETADWISSRILRPR